MSLASSENDECACRVCRFSWGIDLPVPQTGTEDLQSLRTQASKLSTLIFQDFVLLNKTLKRYEGVIQKRWIKKNNIQRTKILLTAWPGMAATHRPDFAQLRDIGIKGCRRRLNRVKEREANLWPYVNQEDLVQPNNLLTFLNSRGRCLPHKFSFGDNVCAHAARPSSKCEEINQRRMILHGKHTPAAYAALHTFKAGDDADMLGLHPITGLLVLEIQERILQFLVSCCRLILHDIDVDHINLHPTKAFGAITSQNSSTWRTVTSITDDIPYRLPQKFDLERLCMLVEAKQSEAEEHLWSLREDPGYFSQELHEWAEHSTEMVLDVYKMRHKSVGKPAFWNRVCKNMIVHAYRSKVFLDELYEELKILISLTKTYAKSVLPSKRLPRPLEEAYQRLDKLVEEMRHEPLDELVVGLPASPPLRSGFERSIGDCTPSFHDLTAKKGPRSSTWRIHVLFRTLLSQDQHEKHGLINIVGEIQRTLDEHSADSDAITPWVANRFADLALVVEIRHQLDLFQPWCTMWRYHAEAVVTDVDYETMALIDDVIVDVVQCRSIKLDIDPAALAYPSDKRRSQVTVARMRASEKELDSMWKKIDQHFVVHTGYMMHEFLVDFFREPNRRLQRTPAWIEPEKSEGSRPVKQAAREWVLKYDQISKVSFRGEHVANETTDPCHCRSSIPMHAAPIPARQSF